MNHIVPHRDPAVAAAFARKHRPVDYVDALLIARAPDIAPEFAATREWLAKADGDRRAYATRVLHRVAKVCPRLLTTPSGNNNDETYASILARFATLMHRTIRNIDDWRPRSRSPHRAFRELAYHLFQRHRVPPFCVYTLLGNHQRFPGLHALLPHVGQGGSFRTANLPVVVTRAVAHALSRLRIIENPRRALRFAQLVACEVEPAIVGEVIDATRYGRFGEPRWEELMFAFMQWLARNPIDKKDVDAVIEHMSERMDDDSGFTLSGRTATSLVRDARAALDARRKYTKALTVKVLPKSGIDGGRYGLIDEMRRVHAESRVWEFEEIVDGPRLFEESKRMRHCVASWIDDAANGTYAIFSITLFEFGQARRGLTLAVDRAERKITEVKGFANRGPTIEERAVIGAWAKDRDLKVDRHA